MALLVLIALVVAFWMPFNNQIKDLDFSIHDTNGNFQFEINEQLNFEISDSTNIKNRKIRWEFGNGDSIINQFNPHYIYQKPGKYLITLTVDNQFSVPKFVDIIEKNINTLRDSIPVIYGVDKGYVNEELVFYSNSPGVHTWYWEFGETGAVDAYEKQVIYKYKKPGIYTVKLQTNTTRFPVMHRIEILPMFQRLEILPPPDSIGIAEEDIRSRLQAIANAKASNRRVFYKNVRHIERTYKCNVEDEMIIVINDEKYNDLYSYCQGLHHLAKKSGRGIEISKVNIDTNVCVKRIEVTQSRLK